MAGRRGKVVKFGVIRYAAAQGDEPITDFLISLRAEQPVLHDLVVAALLRLEDRAWHGPPHTEQVDRDIYEVRVGRQNIARVFFFFQPDRTIVLTHGYVKKQQKLDRGELRRAREYKRDWEARHV